MSKSVRIGELSELTGLHINTLRNLTAKGVIPSTRSVGGQRVFDVNEVERALAGRKRLRRKSENKPVAISNPDWTKSFPISGLQEDLVWAEICRDLRLDLKSNPGEVMPYAFNEMLNNAIDHSRGKIVVIEFWVDSKNWSCAIHDDGEGVFKTVMRGFQLNNFFEAVAELSKGKRTTAPKNHSGEGIFFTSKSVDEFQLSSNGVTWIVDNDLGDQTVAESSHDLGTRVWLNLDVTKVRSMEKIFREFSIDHNFIRSRPSIKLFELGTTFVSRSEAKRLMAGMEKFQEVEIDFKGVQSVGQGFVDEVFRVWSNANSNTSLIPINMNSAVKFMVERGLEH